MAGYYSELVRTSVEKLREWTQQTYMDCGDDENGLFLLNRKQCIQLVSRFDEWHVSLGQQQRPELAVQEISYVLQRAEKLVENCRSKDWPKKALDLGDCEEHFVEILLDMHWSIYMAQIGTQPENLHFQTVEDNQKILLKCLREAPGETVLKDREDDKEEFLLKLQNLREVERPVADRTRNCDLAWLLRDRCTPSWCPPELRAFHLRIHENNIGRGATGVVIEFSWLKSVYALKMPLPAIPGNPELFMKEARFLDRYRNPHILVLIGHWVIDGRPHLLTEFMHHTLQRLIEAKHFADATGAWSKATNVMLQVAKAIRYLHFKDVAHRDLKPGNIMCTVDGESRSVSSVKLIDFGEALDGVTKYTDGGLKWWRAGTTEYTAPEILKENESLAQIDLKKADVHSFGMVFLELLTRKLPSASLAGYNGIRVSDLKKRLIDGERPLIPKDICPNLKFIIESCWAKDPKERPTFQNLCKLLHCSRDVRSGVCEEAATMFRYTDENGNMRERRRRRCWRNPFMSQLR